METPSADARYVRNGFWLEVAKIAAAAIVATVTASWTARGALDTFDKRMALVERQTLNTSEQIKDIHDDIRELRQGLMGGRR